MPRQITVLHVDDDETMLDLTAELLERADHNVSVRSESRPTNVPDRIESEPIDCVVSDFEMPRCDGLELCRTVRARWPNLPFFLFTNNRGADIVDSALAAGVTDYIRKETGVHHYTLLANRITIAVTRHRALQRLDSVGDADALDSLREPVGTVHESD